jgi:hypothetical protein
MSYIFTQRQRLIFPNLAAGTKYNFPLFLHSEDTNVLIADADGYAVDCYEDPSYEAVDHRLFWLDLPPTKGASAEVFMYSGLSSTISAVCPYFDESHAMKKPVTFRPRTPPALFHSRAAVAARWRHSVDVDLAKDLWSVDDICGIESPPCRGNGKVLTMSTQLGRIALRYPFDVDPSAELGRLHVRAYFYDNVRQNSKGFEVFPESSNWLAVATSVGAAAVGVATTTGSTERQGCYSFATGAAPIGKLGEAAAWQASAVRRSKGWHLFEMSWELNKLVITIDNEPVAQFAATGHHTGGSDVWLVSAGGIDGVWGGVEAFHTPLSCGTWDQGVQDVQPETYHPWQHTTKVGRWTCFSDGRVLRQPQKEGLRVRLDVGRDELVSIFNKKGLTKSYRYEMDLMLRSKYDVVKVSEGLVGLNSNCGKCMCFFPPEVLTILRSDFEPGLRARVVSSKSKLLAAFDEIADDYPEDAIGRGRYHPGMDSMMGHVYTVVDVLKSGLVALPSPEGDAVWLFPPSILEMVCVEEVLEAPSTPPPETPAYVEVNEDKKEDEQEEAEEEEVIPAEEDEEEPIQEDAPVAPPPPPIETPSDLPSVCMQLPSETPRERVERAMAFNIKQLVAAGVELPANIQLVDKCHAKEHGGCFVYRFGTRRLHVTTQAVDEGRLLLVVRCGGGFADFAEFAKRHARSEIAKLQHKLPTSATAGCGVLRLSSAFSKRGSSFGNGSRLLSPMINATT